MDALLVLCCNPVLFNCRVISTVWIVDGIAVHPIPTRLVFVVVEDREELLRDLLGSYDKLWDMVLVLQVSRIPANNKRGASPQPQWHATGIVSPLLYPIGE